MMQAGQERVTKSLEMKGALMSTEPIAESESKEPSADKIFTIESRFGQVTIGQEHAIFFPQGLLGLPANLHFGLIDIPGKEDSQIKLLQCLNDDKVSFMVVPVALENKLVEKADLENCCKVLEIKSDDLVTLLIVTVKRTPSSTEVSANARAPIIIDAEQKAGIQYVFPHNKYDIRTPLA